MRRMRRRSSRGVRREGLDGLCDCTCAVQDHGRWGCKTWYGDNKTGFSCHCDARYIRVLMKQLKLFKETEECPVRGVV